MKCHVIFYLFGAYSSVKVNKSVYVAKLGQRCDKTLNNFLLHVPNHALKDMEMLNYVTINNTVYIMVPSRCYIMVPSRPRVTYGRIRFQSENLAFAYSIYFQPLVA